MTFTKIDPPPPPKREKYVKNYAPLKIFNKALFCVNGGKLVTCIKALAHLQTHLKWTMEFVGVLCSYIFCAWRTRRNYLRKFNKTELWHNVWIISNSILPIWYRFILNAKKEITNNELVITSWNIMVKHFLFRSKTKKEYHSFNKNNSC